MFILCSTWAFTTNTSNYANFTPWLVSELTLKWRKFCGHHQEDIMLETFIVNYAVSIYCHLSLLGILSDLKTAKSAESSKKKKQSLKNIQKQTQNVFLLVFFFQFTFLSKIIFLYYAKKKVLKIEASIYMLSNTKNKNKQTIKPVNIKISHFNFKGESVFKKDKASKILSI